MGIFKRKASQTWPLHDRMKAQSRIVDNYYRHWKEYQLVPGFGLYAIRHATINDAIEKVEDSSADSMSAAMEVMANPDEAKRFIDRIRMGRANEIRALQILEAHADAWRRVIGESLTELNCNPEQIVASEFEEYQLQGECLRSIKSIVDDEGIWSSLVMVSERKHGGDIIAERLLS